MRDSKVVATHRLRTTVSRVPAPGMEKLHTCTSSVGESKVVPRCTWIPLHSTDRLEMETTFGVLLQEGKGKTRCCPQVFISQRGQKRASSTAGVCQGSICCNIRFTAS